VVGVVCSWSRAETESRDGEWWFLIGGRRSQRRTNCLTWITSPLRHHIIRHRTIWWHR